jgi:collagenase-like PrtC family protease
MKYDIATNFDKELIKFIVKHDTFKQIDTVYGKLRNDIIGGGRPSYILPDITENELKDYIQECNKNKIKFNYLLNSLCMDNKELQPTELKKILKYIEKLKSFGIYGLTINSPILCEIIKNRYPDISVSIGVYASIISVKHIKYWYDLGADEVTLHTRVNRNFPLLREMLNYTKDKNINIRVIGNNACLHDCPYQTSHANGVAHASQKGHTSSKFFLDYSAYKCNSDKLNDPGKLISSDWIRPEDVKYYTELCKSTGNNKFSIKLVERTKPTEFLEKVIIAYLNESYNGNLIDILNWVSLKNVKFIRKTPMLIAATLGKYNLDSIKKFITLFGLPEINIDNKKLDGFMDKFVHATSHSCESKICGEYFNENKNSSNTCNYCSSWARKSVEFDTDEMKKWLKDNDEVAECFNSGNMFSIAK